jgi:hypothetical protein
MGSVKTDYNDIDDAIRDSIEDTQRGAETRAVREGEINTYTAEVAEGDIKMWQGEAREGYGKLERAIKDAIGGLPNWSGTDVTIEPNWDHKEGPIFWSYDSDPYIAVNAYVRLGQGSTAPGVTVFADHVTGKIEGVDDVLDAGDSDFFNDPATESDYFMLVEELRNPGGARRIGNKVITLYTARPAKDRRIYNNARAIPTNVFLTTSEDEAYGYIADSGGGRDVYKVRIKRMFLVETLDAGSKKNYQTFAGGDRMVPVEDCEMVYEDPQTKIARRVLARWRSGP